ncbi:cutinase family protein [Naumannella halotolerans]|uniref:cutinase family protein n=1 Tax=Naumannella halotolerans TaxID=993414 RepID=UPI001414E44C|nr:cutinase family protein [Naumannella halotolerans]
MTHRLRLGALVATAAALITLPAAPAEAATLQWSDEPPVAASAATGRDCGDLLFVGVRGSAEPEPYGDTIAALRDSLAEQTADLPGAVDLRVREVYLDYPAVSPETLGSVGIDGLLFSTEMPPTEFYDSVTAGRVSMVQVLQDSATRCPDEHWVLGGFSQGAQVVAEALATEELADAADERLLGAVVLGNPANAPTMPGVTSVGDAENDAVGLTPSLYYLRQRIAEARQPDDELGVSGALRSVVELSDGSLDRELTSEVMTDNGMQPPSALFDRITQVCNTGDLICDAGPGLGRMVFSASPLQTEVDNAEPIHLGYASLMDQATAPTIQRITDWAPTVQHPAPAPAAESDRFLLGVAVGVAGSAVLVGLATALTRIGRRRRLDRADGQDRLDPERADRPRSAQDRP